MDLMRTKQNEKTLTKMIREEFDTDIDNFETLIGTLAFMLDRMKRDPRFWDYFEARNMNKVAIFEAHLITQKISDMFVAQNFKAFNSPPTMSRVDS